MSHKLHRLTSSLYNTPLLIEQNAFKGILSYLKDRNESGRKASDDDEYEGPKDNSDYIYNADTKTGLIEFIGPVTAKPVTVMGFDCGGANYQSLKSSFEDLIKMGAKTIAMIVDSPGGDAYSMSDSANYIRQILDENDVKLITFVEGIAASAGYGIACISDELYGSWDSEAGSIGVLVQLWNDAKALEKEGYERTYVTAGKSKVPYADDGSFREEFIQDIQSKVDTCYKNFTEHVAKHRNIPLSVVTGTEAKMFFAEDAIRLGLMDGIKTQEEFYNYVADAAQSNLEGKTMGNRLFKFNKKEDAMEMAQLEELQAQLSAANEQLAGMATLSAQVAEIQAAFGAQTEELKAAKQALAAMEEAKAQAAVEARKASLAEVLPADQVEANLSALSGLDDASFSVVVSTMKAAKDVRAAGSEMMTEVGGEGAELQHEESGEDPITKAALERLRAQKR